MRHWLMLLLFATSAAGFLVVFWMLAVSVRAKKTRLEPSLPAVLLKDRPMLFLALLVFLAALAGLLLASALKILRAL